MNRNFFRLILGGLLAIPVAGGLFFIMQYLIASADPKIDEEKQTKIADIHMPERAIRDPVAVDCQPSGVFEKASVKASTKFKYKPRVIDGEAIEVPGVQNKFTYELEQ